VHGERRASTAKGGRYASSSRSLLLLNRSLSLPKVAGMPVVVGLFCS
jgi:hypothetical protein